MSMRVPSDGRPNPHSTANQESTVLGREVGLRLRHAMQAAGLTGKTMARLLGHDESRISRWLTGRIPVSAMDVVAFLVVCGVVTRLHEPVLQLVREREMSTALRLTAEAQVAGYRDHIGTAEHITEFACLELPWLVRTTGYTRAIAERSGDADLWLRVHQEAESLLNSSRSTQITVLVHEWVLRTPTGGPAVMANQLDHLVRLSSWQRISVRVLPINGRAPAVGLVPFGMAEFTQHRPALYRHEANGLVLWDDPAEVAGYRTTLDQLANAALDEQQSLALMTQLAADVSRSSPYADETSGNEVAMMAR
jgi:transcriptional regulator with XRE-family HTH domain